MNRTILLPAFLLLFFAAGAVAAETQKPLPLGELPDFTISRGAPLYQRYCLFCHGASGAGDGPAGLSLATPPAHLGLIINKRSRKQLGAVILTGGRPNGLNPSMPGFDKTLSARQVEELLDFLRELGGRQDNPG